MSGLDEMPGVEPVGHAVGKLDQNQGRPARPALGRFVTGVNYLALLALPPNDFVAQLAELREDHLVADLGLEGTAPLDGGPHRLVAGVPLEVVSYVHGVLPKG